MLSFRPLLPRLNFAGSSSCGELLSEESITDTRNSFEVLLAIAELTKCHCCHRSSMQGSKSSFCCTECHISCLVSSTLVLYIFHASCKTPFKLRSFVVSRIRPNHYDSRGKKEKQLCGFCMFQFSSSLLLPK